MPSASTAMPPTAWLPNPPPPNWPKQTPVGSDAARKSTRQAARRAAAGTRIADMNTSQ